MTRNKMKTKKQNNELTNNLNVKKQPQTGAIEKSIEKLDKKNIGELNEQNYNPDNVVSWIAANLKKVSTFLEIGTIITSISLISALIIICFKITCLNIVGIPLQLAIDIIDIKPIDFVVEFILIASIYIAMISVDFLHNKMKILSKVAFWIIVILLVIYTGHRLHYSSYILSSMIVYPVIIRLAYLLLKLYFKNRPEKEIKAILTNSSRITQIKVVLFEVILFVVVICIGSMFVANLYLAIPSTKSVVIEKEDDEKENKAIIYSSNSEILAAKFDIDEEKNKTVLKIDTSSIELVEKGNDPIKLTTIKNAVIGKKE